MAASPNAFLGFLLVVLWGALSGCSTAGSHQGSELGNRITVVAPQHYEIWVDKFVVGTGSEKILWRGPKGTVSCCWKAPSGKSRRWKSIPEFVVIEWFSLAEKTSYRALVKLEDPEGIVEQMEQSVSVTVRGQNKSVTRDNLVFGLAPGGQVVVWIMHYEQTAVEVGRYQAEKLATPPGYHQEWIDNYQRDHGAYLQQHGLQLDKW